MTTLTCPECDMEQNVNISEDTYTVVCEYCGSQFNIPREHRVNKDKVQKHKSRVNIRFGFNTDGDMLTVGWTVQSADRGNQYMEENTVAVDISNHPQKTYWYVALFKMLQNISDYKSGRIWVKDDNMLDHLAGDANIADDDLRSQLAEQIVNLADEKFYGYEFASTDSIGGDIRAMVKR